MNTDEKQEHPLGAMEDVETGPEHEPTTDVNVGLSLKEVEQLREKYGWNEIPVSSTPLYMIFLHQFTGFLPILIELAAIVALAVQDYTDFGIIAGILLINGRRHDGRNSHYLAWIPAAS